MLSRLSVLEGCTVRSIRRGPEVLEIEFERGVGLSVHNACNISGLADGRIEELTGATVERVTESRESAEVVFTDSRTVHVDLRDDAFNGPEAMVLSVPGEPTVVWN